MQSVFNSYFNKIVPNQNEVFWANPRDMAISIDTLKKDYLYFQDITFNNPKQGIMNLTGPHQFTRTFYAMDSQILPYNCSHNDIGWKYSSKFGEFISPLKVSKHYSSLREMKTIDSTKSSILREK